ncbi:Phosphate metabolism transcription protein [Recurvomyces mirabilis]|nr:Phosphate metabolism transcription protein [Recurvomyces mirabilis]
MRYGRTLERAIYPPWRENYIDYTKLKKLLREDESAPSSPSTESPENDWTDDDESKFVDELVNVQLEKVHDFHRDTYEKLRDRTAKCEARLDDVAVAQNGEEAQNRTKSTEATDATDVSEAKPDGEANGNGKKPVPSESDKQETLKEVLAELDQITKETNELEKYSRINYSGFLKAAKKHDRKRGTSYRVRPLLQVRLSALPFNQEDYSPLLYRLSAMYSFVRQHLEGAENRGISMSEAVEDKKEYVSHKFWVHPDNMLEVKTMILRRLPVLVYNPQTSKIAEGNQPDPSMTSIYFDSPAFSLYSNKVDNNEASSLRLRWFGQLAEKPQIWVEKKTVKDETSSEQQFTTKEKYIQSFIKGEDHMEKQVKKLEARAGADSAEAKNLKSSVEEVQTFIKEHNLQPVLRANYTRTAFQIPGDDRVRISLDTDLAFIREDAIDDRPCRDPESWHRTDIDNQQMEYPFSAIRKGEVNRFPYALLEIKVRNSGKRTEWIQDIMHSHLVKEAPRFSKFVHGVSILFEDYVNTFPFWLPQLETDIRRDPQEAFEEEQAKRQKQIDDDFAVGSFLKSKPSMSNFSPGKQKRKDIISPVGSPAMAGKAKTGTSAPESRMSKLGNVANVEPTQVNDTAGEPDDDETGTSRIGNERSVTVPGGLKGLFPSFSTSKYAASRRTAKLPPGVSKPENWIKDAGPVKVEAKVWLANQRTFIKWQHVSVLLASLSLGLFNAAGKDNSIARGLAVVYTIVAVLAAAWGYGIYMWRVSLIRGRSGKDFDAVTGPVVVCIGLIVALVLNFGFKYQAVQQDRNRQQDMVMFNQTLAHWGDL